MGLSPKLNLHGVEPGKPRHVFIVHHPEVEAEEGDEACEWKGGIGVDGGEDGAEARADKRVGHIEEPGDMTGQVRGSESGLQNFIYM